MKRLPMAALAALLVLGAAQSRAQDLDAWWRQGTLTGDWGGERPRLKEGGIDLALQWWTNIASNPKGGTSQGTTYTDSWNLSLDFDMDKLAGWRGGGVHVGFTQRAGTSLSAEYIGNLFAVQQVYGPVERWRLTELSVEQSFDGGVWNLRGGRYPNEDFATSPLYCLFMNQGLCGYPGGVAMDLNLPYYPVSAWGARARWRPTEAWQAMLGVFEVNPSLNDTNGFDWSTSGSTGVATVAEVQYTRGGTGPMPGHYKLGLWSQSVDGGSVPGVNDDSWKSGLYLLADQTVMAGRPGSGVGGTPPGLTLLGGLSANRGTSAKVEHAAFAGLVANGLWSVRPGDSQGVAVTAAKFKDKGWETVIELHYGLQLNRWFSLQPNLQWVLRPGATGQTPGAFVVGLQTVIDF
jgi:porin